MMYSEIGIIFGIIMTKDREMKNNFIKRKTSFEFFYKLVLSMRCCGEVVFSARSNS